jgi:hypothetical protein
MNGMNLFIQFIKESTAKQENIAFINSIRKNSNLKPYSLISEVAADLEPEVNDNLLPVLSTPVEPKPTSSWILFDDLSAFINSMVDPYNPSGIDNLYRFRDLPPDVILYFYNLFVTQGNLQDFLNFMRIISRINMNNPGQTPLPGDITYNAEEMFVRFLYDVAALRWINSNIDNLVNFNQGVIPPVLTNLQNTNPQFYNTVLSMLSRFFEPGGANNVYNIGNFYSNMFTMFSQEYGIVFPPNVQNGLTALLELWGNNLTNIGFTINGGGIGVLSPEFLPDPTTVSQNLTNNFSSLNPNSLITTLREIYSDLFFEPLNAQQIEEAARRFGITVPEMEILLELLAEMEQEDFNSFIKTLRRGVKSNDPEAFSSLLRRWSSNIFYDFTDNSLITMSSFLDMIRRIFRF